MIYFNCKFVQAYHRIVIELEDGNSITRHLTELAYKHNEDFEIEYVKDLKNNDLYFPHKDFKTIL